MIGTDDLRDHQARCVPHMAILQMFASNLADVQFPPDAARRVAEATSAILAEARAAGRAALTAVADDGLRSANLSLLTARQARLEHAAEDAIASAREAARGGNIAALRQRLQRFDTLTSAMWTVQMSVWEHAAASREVARLGLSAADGFPSGGTRPLASPRRQATGPMLWPASHRVAWNLCLPSGTGIPRFPARGVASTQGVMRRTGGSRQALPAAGKPERENR